MRDRLRFVTGDLLALDDEHLGRYDLVCCHGVAMYLLSLEATVGALVRAGRGGGMVSLLTRNRASLAMRAGMSGDWAAAMAAFGAWAYDNRLGITDLRADDPAEVRPAMTRAGVEIVAWYGVRLFTDHWAAEPPGPDFAEILAVEEEAGRRDPYRSLAALTHTLARVPVSPDATGT